MQRLCSVRPTSVLLEPVDFQTEIREQIGCFIVLATIRRPHDARHSGYGFTQDEFLADNIDVILNGCGCRHKPEKLHDVSGAADSVQKLPVAQDLGESDGVDLDVVAVKRHHDFIDGLVSRDVKIPRRD